MKSPGKLLFHVTQIRQRVLFRRYYSLVDIYYNCVTTHARVVNRLFSWNATYKSYIKSYIGTVSDAFANFSITQIVSREKYSHERTVCSKQLQSCKICYDIAQVMYGPYIVTK